MKKGQPKKPPHWIIPVLERFERFTDRIIPYLLIALTIILILENPFWTLVHLEEYEPWVTIFDEFVIAFFVIDLVFKWFKVRNVLSFLRLYWLDIIAVFPFFLIYRLVLRAQTIVRIGEGVSEAQKAVHEAVLLREARVLREAEYLREARVIKETRPIVRLVRAVQRLFRVLKARIYVGKATAYKMED